TPYGGIVQFDGTTGTFVNRFVPPGSGTHIPVIPLMGPDGNLYVLDRIRENVADAVGKSGIVRFDGVAGKFLDQFIPHGTGGLQDADGFAFGPTGDLFISNHRTGQINRYDGHDGLFRGAFVSLPIDAASNSLPIAFGPDGHLYAGYTNQISRFD